MKRRIVHMREWRLGVGTESQLHLGLAIVE